MEIKFGTKEELNQERENAFLRLDPSERVWQFFMMIQESELLFKHKKKEKDSFKLEIPFTDND